MQVVCIGLWLCMVVHGRILKNVTHMQFFFFFRLVSNVRRKKNQYRDPFSCSMNASFICRPACAGVHMVHTHFNNRMWLSLSLYPNEVQAQKCRAWLKTPLRRQVSYLDLLRHKGKQSWYDLDRLCFGTFTDKMWGETNVSAPFSTSQKFDVKKKQKKALGGLVW